MLNKSGNQFIMHYMVPACLLLTLLLPVYGSGKKEPGNGPGEGDLIYFINYPYQIWSDDYTKIHFTLLRPDFKPAKGAGVLVNNKEVGRTDANGVCIFDFKPGNNQGNVLEAVYKLKGKRYRIRKSFASNSRNRSFRADRLYVYTDRGVYNPGQNILIRLIAWQLEKEYYPAEKVEVQLLFQDKAGKLYSGEYLTTDQFGVASTKIPLGAHMPEGDYELVVLYEKAREAAELRVERFIPPVIKIVHNLKRYLTDVQEKLEFEVNLDYFASGDLTDSNLEVAFLRDKTGVFTKKLPKGKKRYKVIVSKAELAIIRAELAPEQGFKIRLSATDQYGRSDEVSWDALYTARPFITVLELDKDAYPAGEMVRVLAKIVDIDKQPAAGLTVNFEVQGTGLKKTAETDDKGVAVLEFTMPSQSTVITATTPSVKQPLAAWSVPLQAFKPMVSKVKEPPGQAGSSVEITINFDENYIPVEKVVHVDLTDISGALVTSTTIPVKKSKGRYTARGEVTAPTWGSMLANLYSCAVRKEDNSSPLSPEKVGFITEGQHITFYPDKKLEIIINNFKPAAEPGRMLDLDIEVRGGNKKAEKSLGISVVDGAVLSLKDPFIRAPYSHFYNPQAKVISTGGAGVLTWPVVDRNWGSPTSDIAYSNWGWKSPGPVERGDLHRDDMKTAEEESYSATGSFPSIGLAIDEMDGDSAPPPPPEAAMKTSEAPMEKMAGSMDKQMLAQAPENGNRDRGEDETGAAEMPVIVVRKEFPETAYWEPGLVTEKGKASISFKLPDSITTQTVTLLATDREGNIGFLQEDIKVTQPLFIRSLLPAAMTEGDSLKVETLVQNNQKVNISCQVSLAPGDLLLNPPGTRRIEIPAGETRLVGWALTAMEPGKTDYSVIVNAGGFSDRELRELNILPAGIPVDSKISGTAVKGKSFEEKVVIGDEGSYYVGNLSVSLPGVLPAFQGVMAFDAYPFYSPWWSSSVVTMNSAMLKYLEKQEDGSSEFQQTLRLRIKEAVNGLVFSQLPSGGWGWLAGGDFPPNLYYTVSVLRALTTAREAGFIVDELLLQKAIEYILSQKNSKNLWTSRGAYFWEVFNKNTDYALSAEIFEVLARCFSVLENKEQYLRELEEVQAAVREALDEGLEEPMAVSAGIMGLIYYNRITGKQGKSKYIEDKLQFLINLKRLGYWEPHWYHAYGGMVELNARILELLAAVDYRKYESVIRESVTWILSTRNSFGVWHNEIGTANAISALLSLAEFDGIFTSKKESPGTIKVSVNDRVVSEVKIDPRDPYLSAAKLKFLEITDWLNKGENIVTVYYSGDLEASVVLEIRRWGTAGSDVSGLTKISRKAPSTLAVGQPATVTLEVTNTPSRPFLRIEEGIPSGTEVDISSLDLLLAEKVINGYSVADGKIYLNVAGQKEKFVIKYKLTGYLKGECRHPAALVYDARSGYIVAETLPGKLTVN